MSAGVAAEKWIAGYRLDFDDDGAPEAQILCVGTREECEQTAGLIDAVSYSGDRPNPQATFITKPLPGSMAAATSKEGNE